MRQLVLVTVLATVAFAGARVVEAQETGNLRPVLVRLEDSATVLKARLVSLNADTVTLLVKDQKTSLPLDRVVRITSGRDSIRNGALIGALIGGGLCARNCGQGLNRAGELPLAVALTAGMWGVAGAAVDAMNRREEVIYQR